MRVKLGCVVPESRAGTRQASQLHCIKRSQAVIQPLPAAACPLPAAQRRLAAAPIGHRRGGQARLAPRACPPSRCCRPSKTWAASGPRRGSRERETLKTSFALRPKGQLGPARQASSATEIDEPPGDLALRMCMRAELEGAENAPPLAAAPLRSRPATLLRSVILLRSTVSRHTWCIPAANHVGSTADGPPWGRSGSLQH